MQFHPENGVRMVEEQILLCLFFFPLSVFQAQVLGLATLEERLLDRVGLGLLPFQSLQEVSHVCQELKTSPLFVLLQFRLFFLILSLPSMRSVGV